MTDRPFKLKFAGFIILLLSQLATYSQLADSSNLYDHVSIMSQSEKYRNYKNPDELNRIATYVFEQFSRYSADVSFQTYLVNDITYKNVIARFGDSHLPKLVIGAHYDVCGNQSGADDNASGVAGLLELARPMKDETLPYQLELVAYTLEEPPFFRTEYMGSYIHAQSLNKDHVIGMISLEMIGFFKEDKGSQHYPINALSMIYGKRGDYITLVKKWGSGRFSRKFIRSYKHQHLVRTKKFAAPRSLPGIDFSDHLNYWNAGISALMITDTSFYRNQNYHQPTDTIETLNFTKMNQVVDAVYLSLKELDF